MLFLTMENLHGTFDAILIPDIYQRFRNVFNTTLPLLITGSIEVDVERGESF